MVEGRDRGRSPAPEATRGPIRERGLPEGLPSIFEIQGELLRSSRRRGAGLLPKSRPVSRFSLGSGISVPAFRDAWNTLGRKIKADAEEVFGRSDWLPVRRDMLNDAIGYRSSSLTDPWGKTSRWSEGTREAMRGTFEVMMGEKAYQRLARFEGGLRTWSPTPRRRSWCAPSSWLWTTSSRTACT